MTDLSTNTKSLYPIYLSYYEIRLKFKSSTRSMAWPRPEQQLIKEVYQDKSNIESGELDEQSKKSLAGQSQQKKCEKLKL